MWREKARLEKKEKERKTEEEEEGRENRLQSALEEYLACHKKEQGVSFESIAKKHKRYQKDLEETYWNHTEEIENLRNPNFDDSDEECPM